MTKKALGVLISAVLFGACTAYSQTIFGAAYNGPGGPATLYTISPTTGAATVIGPIGAGTVSGMAFAPGGVTLYGVGINGVGFSLLRINTSTGAGTAIGPTNLSAPCEDMTFRSDGVLFCYSLGSIYTLNTATGAATLVGNTGDFPDGNGLAFSSGNILYTANNLNLRTVNQSTGAVTVVTPLTYGSLFGTNPRASAMKFHPNGTLYASVIAGFGGRGGSSSASLGTINISSGAVTRVGPTTVGMDALAISGIQFNSVPAPSSWLLVITGIALVVLFLVLRSRKNRTTVLS